MAEKEFIKKNDFIELKYTGFANNEVFDSNIEGDLKKLKNDAKPEKTVIAVGHEMVLKGLDKALEGKEIGKEYEISLTPKESFGERKRELIKTIPLKAFTENKVSPYPGLVLTLDNMLVRIITISGARVITDFNNPLSGKQIKYKFIANRIVKEDKEKVEALFLYFFKIIPEYEIKEKIILKGPKPLEFFVKSMNDKFKEILGKELAFEEKKEENKKPDNKQEATPLE